MLASVVDSPKIVETSSNKANGSQWLSIDPRQVSGSNMHSNQENINVKFFEWMLSYNKAIGSDVIIWATRYE